MRLSSTRQAATASQLRYLKALAEQTGTSFAYPQTRAEASREIDRLRRLKASGRPLPVPPVDERALAYATAPRREEISGYGSSARWRSRSPSDDDDAPPIDPSGSAPGTRHAQGFASARGARCIGRYPALPGGAMRELVTIPGAGGSVLVVDRLASTSGDARLVGHLGVDEPPENARILCRAYLADETRGRCRRLTAEDLELDAPPASAQTHNGAASVGMPLRDCDGNLYRIREVSSHGSLPELRWTRSRGSEPDDVFDVLTLRDVVGRREDYEPARSATHDTVSRHRDDDRVSTCRLAGELERLTQSPIVLNRGLREALERALAAGHVSMSEIAARCGQVKRGECGSASGDTSWLARRVGLLPEGGHAAPTPWIHTEVLARIARDGLGLSPLEVELG
jgi:hypothetical protein